ncbi:hypothetical protein TcasGA2_TC032463 [Tribolium castaneum]|uniref:Uncharacterized protein n=1 Tax=Tribolium castaneum TaxID=7070 RepID=A0A139WLT9_TRICA|nr:hypothetical protein TcasGA2_TC032463 [Tribolium castaneum]
MCLKGVLVCLCLLYLCDVGVKMCLLEGLHFGQKSQKMRRYQRMQS